MTDAEIQALIAERDTYLTAMSAAQSATALLATRLSLLKERFQEAQTRLGENRALLDEKIAECRQLEESNKELLSLIESSTTTASGEPEATVPPFTVNEPDGTKTEQPPKTKRGK